MAADQSDPGSQPTIRLVRVNLELKKRMALLEGDNELLSRENVELKTQVKEGGGGKGSKTHLSAKLLQEFEARAHEAEDEVEALLNERETLRERIEELQRDLEHAHTRTATLEKKEMELQLALEDRIQELKDQDEAEASAKEASAETPTASSESAKSSLL